MPLIVVLVLVRVPVLVLVPVPVVASRLTPSGLTCQQDGSTTRVAILQRGGSHGDQVIVITQSAGDLGAATTRHPRM